MESNNESGSSTNCTTAPQTPTKKRKIQKRIQKYKPEWEKEYDWLSKDPQNIFNAKCTPCNIAISIGKSGIGQIKQHAGTKQHNLKIELSKKTSTLDRFFSSSETSSVSQANTCDDKITASELALTFHTVKHNLSYKSMDCTVKLNKIIYVDSKTALNQKLGRTKMEALVEDVLGPFALQTLISALNAPDLYFCLQTDASNRKNIKLFPLVVQYFDIENGIQNKLLDFYENCDESANGMFDAINKSLSQNNLSFDRVSGLSADNCIANFGVHHSLYKKIEHLVPNLVNICLLYCKEKITRPRGLSSKPFTYSTQTIQ